MKKYNSFLGAFFSGDNGQGGYNAAYEKKSLANLYGGNLAPEQEQEALSGLSRVNPEAANKWQEETVKKSAQLLLALGKDNPVAQQAWQTRIKPNLSRIYGAQAASLPDLPDDSVMAVAQQIAGTSQGALPSDVQSFDYFTQGMNAEEKEKARRIKIGLDQKVGAEGIKYLPNGGAAYEDPVSKKIYMINPGETTWREFSYPTAMGGTTQQPDPTQVGDFKQAFTGLASKHGAQITSITRTPEENRRVGGVANSYHLTSQAGDFVVPQQNKAQFMADARAMGLEAIDEGDHIHLEPMGRAAPPVTTAGRGATWADTSKPKDDKIETWGQPFEVMKDGKVILVERSNLGNERESKYQPKEGSSKAPTVDASNAAGFYRRMAQSEQIIGQLEQQGYSPASNKGDYFTAGGTMTNWATSPKGQQYYNAATNWIRANLRKESGAAIGVDEAKQEFSTYFPIPGDTKETIEQKRQLRQQTAESVKGAGLPAMKYQDQSGGKSQANGFDPLGILK